MEQKKRWPGPVPFGYRWNSTTEKLEIVEEEAAVIRRMVDLYLDNVDYSFNDIALQFYREHVPTQKGKKWNSANISALLSRTIYYGYTVTNTKVHDPKTGRIIGDKPPEEHVVWDDIPEIIPYVRWKAVQDKAATGLKRAGRPIKQADEFLLHGLLKCGVCGDVIVPAIVTKQGRRHRYYMCRWRKVANKVLEIEDKTRCALFLLSAQPLEDWVWDQLMVKFGKDKEQHLGHLLPNDRFDEQIEEEKEKIESIKKLIARKERTIHRLNEQLEMAEEDEYDPTEFRFKRRQYKNEINQHKKELEAVNARIDDLRKAQAEQEKLKELLGNEALLSGIWLKMDNLPLTGKKRLLEGLLDGPVAIYPFPYTKKKRGIPPIDAVKSRPRFRYNEAILSEVLGPKIPCGTSGRKETK